MGLKSSESTWFTYEVNQEEVQQPKGSWVVPVNITNKSTAGTSNLSFLGYDKYK